MTALFVDQHKKVAGYKSGMYVCVCAFVTEHGKLCFGDVHILGRAGIEDIFKQDFSAWSEERAVQGMDGEKR